MYIQTSSSLNVLVVVLVETITDNSSKNPILTSLAQHLVFLMRAGPVCDAVD